MWVAQKTHIVRTNKQKGGGQLEQRKTNMADGEGQKSTTLDECKKKIFLRKHTF